MDLQAFRQAFPEFANEQTYPDPMVNFWAEVGDSRLNKDRWGDLLTQGMYLFVAHHISLAAQNVSAAARGRAPGQHSGILSGKGVGGVSANYDTSSVSFQDAGNWNLTQYGRDFWQLMNIVGMGGYYV